jgi:hypothetical protein
LVTQTKLRFAGLGLKMTLFLCFTCACRQAEAAGDANQAALAGLGLKMTVFPRFKCVCRQAEAAGLEQGAAGDAD